MSCWEGAEGSSSKSQRHQSESELGHNFLFDDAKLDELPGPKFRSLRHLRQVKLFTFIKVFSELVILLCIIILKQLFVNRKLKKINKNKNKYIIKIIKTLYLWAAVHYSLTCSAGSRDCWVSSTSVARAHGKSGHMEGRRPRAHPISFYSAQGILLYYCIPLCLVGRDSHYDMDAYKLGEVITTVRILISWAMV